jgi:hypothetical protein
MEDLVFFVHPAYLLPNANVPEPRQPSRGYYWPDYPLTSHFGKGSDYGYLTTA